MNGEGSATKIKLLQTRANKQKISCAISQSSKEKDFNKQWQSDYDIAIFSASVAVCKLPRSWDRKERNQIEFHEIRKE